MQNTTQNALDCAIREELQKAVQFMRTELAVAKAEFMEVKLVANLLHQWLPVVDNGERLLTEVMPILENTAAMRKAQMTKASNRRKLERACDDMITHFVKAKG